VNVKQLAKNRGQATTTFGSFVVPRELKIVALARHADGDVPDT
jgi:hypothetical protein